MSLFSSSLDADYSVDEFNFDEQLSDTESDEQSSEQVAQKKLDNINLDYKIFTTQFDEVVKAENLENADEATKLRRNLDQQLIGFQDIITKLANNCLLYTSPSPRDQRGSRMPSSA